MELFVMRGIQVDKREKFISIASASGKSIFTLQDIKDLCVENDIKLPQWYLKDMDFRAGRGLYKVPSNNASVVNMATAQVLQMKKSEPVLSSGNRITNIVTDLETENLVPKQYVNYVPFGNFDDLLSVVQSKLFFPIFITGQSGNGKTMSVEQACAKAKRKFVCVSMTPDTDESDLLGNYVLINGQMEWRDGPVTVAARQLWLLPIQKVKVQKMVVTCSPMF